jgi:hypothetical protein
MNDQKKPKKVKLGALFAKKTNDKDRFLKLERTIKLKAETITLANGDVTTLPEVVIPKGSILNLNDPRSLVDYLVEQGTITPEAGASRKSKLPSTLKHEVSWTISPDNNKSE